MKSLLNTLIFIILGFSTYSQNIPNLGYAHSFGLFSGGSLTGNDSLVVHGDIGYLTTTDSLLSSSNICDSNCSNFQQVQNEIDSARAFCNELSGVIISSSILSDTTFYPGVYTFNGNIQFNSNIILHSDSDSVFVFNITDTLFCLSGFNLNLINVNPKNIYFNIGKSLVCYDGINISGIFLINESTLLGDHFNGKTSLLCSGDIYTQGKMQFYSAEKLNSVDFDFLYFGQKCGLKYLQVGAPINQDRTVSGTSCTNAGYAQPVTLNVTLPASYAIEAAYLMYASVATPLFGFPVSSQIQLTNPNLVSNMVQSNLIKQDGTQSICWLTSGPNGFNFTHSASYRADVTPLITGSGNYVIDQIPSSTEVDPNGITLLIVYTDNNKLHERGTLLVYNGLFVNQAAQTTPTIYTEIISHPLFAPGTTIIPSASNAFIIVADIEANVIPSSNNFILNNQSLAINANCATPYSQMWKFVTSPPTYFAPNQTSISLIHKKASLDCYAIIAIGAFHITQTIPCGSYSCAGPDKYICQGDPVTLTACPSQSYLWSTGQTTQSIVVTPQTTATYTLTVNSSITDNVTVYVSPLPIAPIVSGNTDGCFTDGYFNVVNPNSGYSYSWTGTIGSITTSGTGTNFIPSTDQVPYLSQGGTITFTVINAYGCVRSTTVIIESCCLDYQMFSPSVTSAIVNTNFSHLFYPYNSPPVPLGGFYVLDPTATSSPNTYMLPVTFTINANLSINYTHFKLFYFGRIVIEPGITLKITNSSSLINCTWMWDKILIKTGGHLIIENNSVVSGGMKAVYAEKDTEFSIRDAFFNNNYISIHCEEDDFSTSSIRNVDFTSGSLDEPYLNQKSYKHIDLVNVSAISIGDGSSLNFTNSFSNAGFGIFAVNSSFDVKNNVFSNITNTPGVFSGHGIFTDAQNNQGKILIVGGVGMYDYNTFQTSTSGIFTKNGSNAEIRNNYFNNILTGSISCRITNSKSINALVQNNYFNGFGTGILIQNVEGSTVNLSQNYFNNAGATEGTYAIKLFNAIVPSQTNNTTISGNFARNITRSGFWLTNYPQAQINGVNTIEFEVATPSSGNNNNQVKWGMKIQNSAKVQILENYIQRPSTSPNGNNPTSAFDTKRFGISVETSYLNTISSNNIIKLGTGIRYFNATTNIITCNDLFHNRIGVSLEGSNIGDQGNNGNSQDNKWNDYATTYWDIKSLAPLPLTPLKWYAQSPNLPWTAASNLIDPPSTINFPYAPSVNGCTNPCPNCRQEEMYRIVTEDGDYALLTEDELYVLKKEVFLEIQQDSIWVNMNTSFDQPLQAFYDSTLQTSMGQLNLVQSLIPSDTTEAKTLISIIQARNHFEENERAVYEIYLATWSRGIEEFTTTQYETLLAIALENPISGGPAVYTARVMLDLDIDDFIPENGRLAQQQSQSIRNHIQSKVYPNPTSDLLSYRLILSDYENIMVFVEDVYGRMVSKYKYNSAGNILRITLENIHQGIYTVKAFQRNVLIDSQKIVKVN